MASPTHHDPSKVLLGTVESSDRIITCEPSDPATYKAGLAVRRDTTGALSLSTGQLVGVSLGASLSDTAKTAVCRAGNLVPLKLKDEGEFASLVVGDLTFTAVEKGTAGNSITITLADTATAGSETVEVTDLDIVIGIDSTTSTASQIETAILVADDALALIGVEVAGGEEASPQTAAAEAPLANGLDKYPYAVVGHVVKIEAGTGLACSDGSSVGAVYMSTKLEGVIPGAASEDVALIDMGGGL